MRITFVQTGGTIDKDYPRSRGGYAFEIGEPAAGRLMERWQATIDFCSQTACRKDSTEITDEDRAALAALIADDPNDHVVVTHGTDTLLETAAFLADRVGGKRVVLTGAMRPERFSDSDAPLNLGCAVGALQLADPGVYVAMHGVVGRYDQVRRSADTHRFERI
ncbi:MAG: asparaginase [Planctomycetes bacterium]|nr:asparaginase [Planctomycetota bacterium]